MASFNRVFLMGNLTRDPDLRYTPSGMAVAKLGLAVNHSYTDKSGEKHESTCFVDVTTFGRTAENCNQYLRKGRPVFVEGRLDYQTWETKEGDKRSKHEVVAERVQFLGSGSREGDDEGGGEGAKRGGDSPRAERSAPAARGAAPRAPSRSPAPRAPASDGGAEDMPLDDIPF